MLTSSKIMAVDEPAIHVIRGQRVTLDSGLATIYQVTTKRLHSAFHVRERSGRFRVSRHQAFCSQQSAINNS